MKQAFRPMLPVALAALLSVGAAHAQSSVTVYGLIDASLVWTNDVAGKRTLNEDSGVSQGNRLGFKGTEDLGGGLKADFRIEHGFNTDAGTTAQGGVMWGRNATVGLSSDRYGSLSLGRTFDVTGDVFPAYAVATNTPAGLMAWSLPMNSAGGLGLTNRVSGMAVNNSVKYYSPKWAGFSFGGTYSLGEVSGKPTAYQSAYSLVASYAVGAFSTSAATYFKHDASPTEGNLKEYALGAAYQMEKMRLFGMVSQVGYSSGAKDRVTTGEIGLTYKVLPTVVLGAGLQAQKRRDLASADQITLTADYLFSKRTDAYLVLSNGRDREYGAQIEGALGGKSSSTAQTGLAVGMRHKF
ncbi:porin [Ideonella sp. B7]|uniref:porin n=1 Tax=Ideonella benzenivorans TaxID=2831643 RepID=UPI001CED715B|nr:porin [Ideonella benzenivorans]MCA6215971.1 porin [Ideonella benzenivorans]